MADAHASERFSSDAEVSRIAEAMIGCSLPALCWTHGAHWAAALYIIACRPDLDPPHDLPGLIRRYNESLGNHNTETSGYHETITQASLRAGYAHLAAAPPGEPLHLTLNRLLASPLGHPSWLLAYWSAERLMSVEARRCWREPDLAPLPFAEPPPRV